MALQLIGILVVVAVVIWIARRFHPAEEGSGPRLRPYAFKIVFKAGRVAAVDGRVPRPVYNAFEEVAAITDAHGEVRLAGGGLTFSASIPEPVRQQFRNVYVAGRL